MLKTRFDIECENFDLYFASVVPTLTPAQKEKLPRDITFKLFRKGGSFNTTSSSKLGFIARLVILWKCLRKRIWIVVEDEENGLTIEQFLELREAQKKKDYSQERASGWIANATFITASKELGDTFAYLNLLSTGPAYNYLMKGKNNIQNKTSEWNKQMKFICNFLAHYESIKKVIVSEAKLSMPEFFVLLYYYNGKESAGSFLYKDFYKRAYQSSPTKIKTSFGTLQHIGYLEKTGQTKGASFRITALGSDTVNWILSKYVLNS